MTRRNLRAWLDEYAAEGELEILVADGFDAAIIGLTAYQPGRPVSVVYDYEKCVEILRKQRLKDTDVSEEGAEEDAREWMEFNVVGAWVGEGTPIFLERPWKK